MVATEDIVIPKIRRFVSVPELAAMIGCSDMHIHEQIRLGKIPATRIGRRIIIPASYVDDLLAKARSNVEASVD